MKGAIDQLTADIIIQMGDGKIVLAKRGSEPYKGKWALPGGKLDGNETIEETAIREAKEETGLDIKLQTVLGVYSRPDRDPRGRFVSVVFTATVTGGELKAGSDAAEVKTISVSDDMELAFDHNEILADYKRTI